MTVILSRGQWVNAPLALQWRHNGHDGVSNHQPHDCLPNRLFRRRSKRTSKLRVTGLCAGNSPATGEFPAQRASKAENVSIWWRHHGFPQTMGDRMIEWNYLPATTADGIQRVRDSYKKPMSAYNIYIYPIHCVVCSISRWFSTALKICRQFLKFI